MAAEGLSSAFHKGNVFKGCEQFKNSLKINKERTRDIMVNECLYI